MAMLEVEKALGEISRLHAELERQIRLERHVSKPSEVRIRTLEGKAAVLHSKLAIMKQLQREVKDLEQSLSLKMMTRYPENQPYRNEWRRELHRSRRRLTEMAASYQPKEKPKPRWAAA